MTDDDTSTETSQPDLVEGGDGDGIERTTGKPNSFEPEEDPDAANG